MVAFWKNLNQSTSFNNKTLSDCKKEGYQQLFQYTADTTKAYQLYKQPCTQMTITLQQESSKTNSTNMGDGNDLVAIEYQTLQYKEIKNVRAFSLESMFGQYGGFIGMFLGYSLLGIPELFGKAADGCKKMFAK